jgi:hypothetical protein
MAMPVAVQRLSGPGQTLGDLITSPGEKLVESACGYRQMRQLSGLHKEEAASRRASSTDSINPSGGYRLSAGALHHTPNVMALTGNAANGADMERHHVDGLQATPLLHRLIRSHTRIDSGAT